MGTCHGKSNAQSKNSHSMDQGKFSSNMDDAVNVSDMADRSLYKKTRPSIRTINTNITYSTHRKAKTLNKIKLTNYSPFQVQEYNFSVFKTYTTINATFLPRFLRQKCIVVQHNLTGKVRFARLIPWDSITVPPIINWIKSKNLSHPNLQTVYEIYKDTKNYYLIEDCCSGGTIEGYIKENKAKVPERQIKVMLLGMISCLAYLHSQGLAHGRLALNSFLFTDDSNEKNLQLIDYEQLFERSELAAEDIIYASPEVCSNKPVTWQSDVWSLGVLFHYLLTGEQLIADKQKENRKRNIMRGVLNFDAVLLEKACPAATELLKRMLTFEQVKRPTLQQCLQQDFLMKLRQSRNDVKNFLIRCRTVKEINQLQACILLFMANHYFSNMKSQFHGIFNEFDQNKDLKISHSELQAAYSKVFGESEDTSQLVRKIFTSIDTNENGFIELDEFILATLDRQALLTKENLEETFKLIDRDKNGKISTREMSMICPLQLDVIKRFYEIVDKNQDGVLQLSEFKQLMQQLL